MVEKKTIKDRLKGLFEVSPDEKAHREKIKETKEKYKRKLDLEKVKIAYKAEKKAYKKKVKKMGGGNTIGDFFRGYADNFDNTRQTRKQKNPFNYDFNSTWDGPAYYDGGGVNTAFDPLTGLMKKSGKSNHKKKKTSKGRTITIKI